MGPPATPSCLLATAHTPAGVLVASDANPDLIVREDVLPRFGQVEQLADAADLVLGGAPRSWPAGSHGWVSRRHLPRASDAMGGFQ